MIRLASPTFGPTLSEEIRQVLNSGQLVQGRQVKEFEDCCANHLGVQHAVAVMNGTTALELGLVALGVGPGVRVGVPAYSFVASASAILRVGATPVFLDVRSSDLTVDPDGVLGAWQRQEIDLFVPVDEFGFPADVEFVRDRAPDLKCLEDAACAFGTTATPPIGSRAEAWCYSLHPRKLVTAGEGGLICTDDEELAAKVRLYRDHGLVRSGEKIDCAVAGTNARMTEIQAVIALDQLRSLNERLSRRRGIADIYLDSLKGGIFELPIVPSQVSPNWQTFLLRFPSGEVRDAVANKLTAGEVGSSVAAQCIPAMSWYRDERPDVEPEVAFPEAWRAWQTGLAIPLHEQMTEEDVETVVDSLVEIREIW